MASITTRWPIHSVEDNDRYYYKENNNPTPKSISSIEGLVNHDHLISTHSIIVDDYFFICSIPESPIVFNHCHSIVRAVRARSSVIYDDLFSWCSKPIIFDNYDLILTAAIPPIVIDDNFFSTSKHPPVFFNDDSIVSSSTISCSVASVHKIIYQLYFHLS